MGFKIAMDDFGTGYSSFSYLQRYPLDVLKIAMPFIQNITEEPTDVAIVQAIIAMSHCLNLKVIAEGIETEEQLQILISSGCDIGQGFLLARPLSVEQVTLALQREQAGEGMGKAICEKAYQNIKKKRQ